jgi:hypothetical protein
MKWYQQGDVLLKLVDKVPDGATRLDHLILTQGEVTGHAHVAHGEGVAILEVESGRYLCAPVGGTVLHPEHRPVLLPPGIYRVERVVEWDHFGQRNGQVHLLAD